MDLQLQGKRALVTGSTSGIGEAVAKALAVEGVAVAVHGRNRTEAERVLAEVTAAGGRAALALGDLDTDAAARSVVEQTLAALGGVDIVVNNAGVYPARGWLAATPEQWLATYNTNAVSMVRVVQPLVPPMRERGWGRVIVMSSVGAVYPKLPLADYHATKAANLNMAVSLSRELADTGITVNAVSPGPILTPGFERQARQVAAERGWGDDWSVIERRVVEERMPNPTGRLGRVEDVAAVVAFLCSPLAGYVNGADIRVDGGFIPTIN